MNYFDNLRTLYNNPIEIKGFKQLNKKGLFPEEEILIKKHLKPGKKVLVIGCGAGRECFVLAEMGFEVVGVDISKEMVAAAKKLSEKKKLNIKFFESNILDFDYKKESFDYVLMLEQMYNLIPFKKNRLLLLKKVRFLLKKNGLFIFSAYSKLYFHLIFPYLFVKFPQNLIRNLFSSKDKLMHLQQSKYSFSNPKPLSRIKLLKRFFGKVYYALKLFLREPIFLFKNIYRLIQKIIFKKRAVLEPGDLIGNPSLFCKNESLKVVFKYFSPKQITEKIVESDFKLVRYYSRDELLENKRFMGKIFTDINYYVAEKF